MQLPSSCFTFFSSPTHSTPLCIGGVDVSLTARKLSASFERCKRARVEAIGRLGFRPAEKTGHGLFYTGTNGKKQETGIGH